MTSCPEPAFIRALQSVDDDAIALLRAKCGTAVEWVEIDLRDLPFTPQPPAVRAPAEVSK